MKPLDLANPTAHTHCYHGSVNCEYNLLITGTYVSYTSTKYLSKCNLDMGLGIIYHQNGVPRRSRIPGFPQRNRLKLLYRVKIKIRASAETRDTLKVVRYSNPRKQPTYLLLISGFDLHDVHCLSIKSTLRSELRWNMWYSCTTFSRCSNNVFESMFL